MICLPELDMIYISRERAECLTASVFKDSLLASKCLHRIKSIAISTAHPNFAGFIDDFKNYSGLELVFIVVGETSGNDHRADEGDVNAIPRRWGINDGEELVDSRLASKREILFEVLHQLDASATNYQIPGLDFDYTQHGVASFRRAAVLQQLVMKMARGGGGGLRVSPNVRFVRVVKPVVARQGWFKGATFFPPYLELWRNWDPFWYNGRLHRGSDLDVRRAAFTELFVAAKAPLPS